MKMVTNGEISIGVVNMSPARKKPCLCVMKGNVITKYGTFTNEKAADEFIEALAELTGARDDEKS